MSAARTFNVGVKRAQQEDPEFPPIEYTFNEEPVRPGGKPTQRIVKINRPGDGALMLLAAAGGNGVENVQALFSVFRQACSTADFLYLKTLVESDEISAADLTEMLSDAIEEWSGFPTQSPSDSPPSQPSSGGRSTGRVRGSASTSPASPTTDS